MRKFKLPNGDYITDQEVKECYRLEQTPSFLGYLIHLDENEYLCHLQESPAAHVILKGWCLRPEGGIKFKSLDHAMKQLERIEKGGIALLFDMGSHYGVVFGQ